MDKKAKETSLQDKFLEKCEIPLHETALPQFTMVIFGGAGDLSQRLLMPSLYHIFGEEKVISDFSILGFGMPKFSDDKFRKFMQSAIKKFASQHFKENEFAKFAKHLFYQTADLADENAYKVLCEEIEKISPKGKNSNVLFYLAVPPKLLPVIVGNLNKHNLCKGMFNSKVIVEKPFGHNKETAYELNELLLGAFDEKQIFRIDHFLGKDTVQNIIFFRFGNSIFEPLWNRRYIDHVQISVPETLGVEHRGAFYEQAGVVRDMVQNHIMQLIALVAMEPPVGFEADLIRDEKVKVFKTIRPMDDKYIDEFMVRGQYSPGKINGKSVPAYRNEENVSARSNIATFFAGKFYIDNWRWSGVPFYVRVGKRMPKTFTEISIHFKQPPLKLLGRTCDTIEANQLILNVQPNEEISVKLNVKYPGSGNRPYAANMEFNYERSFGIKKHPAYERLIGDCIKGDLTLFARQDGVEAMWSVVDPIISRWEKNIAKGFPNYAAGTWGPKEAQRLIVTDGRRWRDI
ncbi:MAG: glucose-6-phosphate dehydrogenase [Candidatus Zixiibacteriota bacterium]